MEGSITSWNQASKTLYGYQKNEVIGQHVALIYPPEEQEFLLEKVIKPLQAKGFHEVKVIRRRKSGEDFHSHLSLSLLKDSIGEVCGMIGYLTGISDRKSLEKELALRQARFDAFFTDSPVGLCILNEIEAVELDYIVEDLPRMISSMKVGADRIRDIVLSLRTFSRLDEAEMKKVDIHEGIKSTLMILQNRLKHKSDRPAINVIKEYGDLPEVECYPGQWVRQLGIQIAQKILSTDAPFNKLWCVSH